MTLTKTITLPAEIFARVEEEAARDGISFSCACSRMLARACGFPKENLPTPKNYRLKGRISDMGVLRASAPEKPLPCNLGQLHKDPYLGMQAYHELLRKDSTWPGSETPITDSEREFIKKLRDEFGVRGL